MSENNASGLSAAEEAYFETGGEAPLTEAPPAIDDKPDPIAKVPEQQAPVEKTAEEKERDERGRFVPHAALHQTREELKATKTQLQELAQWKQGLEERARWIAEQQAVPAAPNPDEDLFAAHKFEAQQWRQELAALRGQLHERQQFEQEQAQAAQQEQQIWTYWNQDSEAYAKQNPEFPEAAQKLAAFRSKQLAALATLHPQLADPRVRDAQINQELKDIVQAAARQGFSPSEAIFNMAKEIGLTSNGAPQLPGKLQSIQQAQAAARGVGSAPGRASGGDPDLEQILAMPREEFMRWHSVDKNARYYDRLMGG